MAFKKGESGNKAGRPKGALNQTTILVQNLMAKDAAAISKKVIQSAKDGDLVAARLILERICPPVKDYPIQIKLPQIKTMAGILEAFTVINESISNGELTPNQAKIVGDILEMHRKALETDDLEKRIEELEKTK